MSSSQVLSPALPFMGKLPGEMQPGCRIRLRGVVSRPNGDCRIHLQTGGTLSPLDDVALHLNVLPATREILRNSYCTGQWGQEERVGSSPVNFEEEFELGVGADSVGFNIEIGGRPFASFSHRCPVQMARYIFITGGCVIRAVVYENWNLVPKVISVLPSAPVYNPQPPQPLPMPFHIPSWPHGNLQYFAPPPSVYPQVSPTAFNPAVIFQNPFQMNIHGATHKNNDHSSTMQYKILIAVLWKICCMLFKALKYIVVALVGGFGVYILSKRLRL